MGNGWNRLPATVVNADTVNAFKNAYDCNYVKDMDNWTSEADELAGPSTYKYK